MAKVKVEKDTSERWLLTYADLMNLLVIFFIILYSMSQVDQAKFTQLAESLRMSLGISSGESMLQGGTSPSIINLETTAPASFLAEVEKRQMEEFKEQVENMVKDSNLNGKITVSLEERGVKISINSKFLFPSGSAQIVPDSKPTVEEIGNMLKGFPDNRIRVEGHTDNDPVNTPQFPSNWELSSARSTNIVRTLVEKCNIDPKSISAVGYGEFQPVAPNTNEANKSKNRRVDIVLLKKDFGKDETGLKEAK